MALYFTSRAHNRVVYYRYHTSVHRRAYNRAGSGFDTVSIDARNSLLRTLCVGSVAAMVIDIPGMTWVSNERYENRITSLVVYSAVHIYYYRSYTCTVFSMSQ